MKKATRTVLALVAVLMCGILATESAFARGGRVRLGISIGFPLVGFGYQSYYPSYYNYPSYYSYPSHYSYPSYYPAQQQAPVYIEQNPQPAPEAQSPSTGSWYYCADSRAYYPYVKECPAGWQRVAPQPR
ncbi:MAG: hypothetical protein AABM33_10825 [Pseudomonadota bacterium]